MKTSISILLFLPLLAAIAQEVPPASAALRLDDCIAEALTRNPSLKASESRRDAAEAKSREATAAYLPQLRFSGRAAELSKVPEFRIGFPPLVQPMTIFPSITENYSLRLSLQQPLFTGFRILSSSAMASYGADASREELDRDRNDVIVNVTTAYWNLHRAREVLKTIRQTKTQLAEHVRDVKNFATQGLATDADVMKVQAQYSDVSVRVIESESNARIAAMALNSLIGRPLDSDVVPADSLGLPDTTAGGPSLEFMTATALDKRSDVRAMELRRSMSEEGVSVARAGWYPQVFLGANYDYARPNQRIIPAKDRWDDTWDVSVNVQWTLWDWLATSNQSAQAQASLRQAEAGVTQVRDAVAIDVARQYFTLTASQEKVSAAMDGERQAAEAHRITRDRYRQGLAANAELLDAETALMQARLTLTNAKADYAIARVQLRRAIGERM